MIKPGDEPIPGYRVEELLGRGQFGQVWRARSPGNTSLALKFLELSGTHGWKEFRAIQRVKQIRHAHLMPIVAIWLLDEQGQVISDDAIESIAASHHETICGPEETLVAAPVTKTARPAQLIVATLLANQTLGDRFKECQADGHRGIPVDELLGYMAEAAKGLDFLNSSQHKVGDSLGAVQHCDVKPDNIMLTGGSVVISDFGVAQTLAQARQNATATSLGGTPAYMAPECFLNRPSRSSDQYSLAISYYELRTGRLPFDEHTYAAVFKAHQEGTLDFSACGAAEQHVLRTATSTDPSKRFASCAELVEKLQEAVQPAPKPAPRRGVRGLAAAGAAALAVSAALAVVAIRLLDDEPPVPRSRVTIAVTPPDAQLTVDGQPLALDSDGRAVVERPVGQAFIVKASKSPERLDSGEIEIEPREGEQRREIRLEYAAVHFADEADRLLDDGRFDDAVAALAQAIKLEPVKYARLPEPILAIAGAERIDCLQVSDSGRWLAAGSADGAVRQWSLEDDRLGERGDLLHRHEAPVKEAVITDDSTASLDEDGKQITLRRPAEPVVELTVPDDAGDIKHVAITGGGRWLVAASEMFGQLPPVRIVGLHAWDLESQNVAASYRPLLRQEGEFEPLLAAAHQQAWVVLATTTDVSHVVRRCPIDSQESAMIHAQSGEIKALAVAPNDRWIAVGGGPVSEGLDAADYNATLIDAGSNNAATLRRGHTDSISTIAFDADGDYLTTGGSDGEAQAWTIADDRNPPVKMDAEPVFLQDGKAPISSVACPTAGWAVCSYQGKAALWDCKPGDPQPLWLSRGTAPVTAVAATPSGALIITAHNDGSLRFWPALRLKLVARACAAAGVTLPNAEATADQLTRCGRPCRPVRRYPSGSGETESVRRFRPTASLVG
jgi:WD40 repeat protein